MSPLLHVVLCLLVTGQSFHQASGFAVSADVEGQDELQEGAALRIASFNVQIFGNKKMDDAMVRDVLVKVILRYDIILIMEIRSVTDDAINELLELVNGRSTPRGVYSMALSNRLGRSSSKEQYAFLYRTDRVTAVDSYVYDDSKVDVFQREPFMVCFTSSKTYVKDFVFAAIHTSPSDAVQEIDHLADVYDDIIKQWGVRDVIIMGDYNAGCSYVKKSDWDQIRLAVDPRFFWLFTNDIDTTVARSDCPYDRMVVAGENMIRGLFPKTAKAFRYDKAYDLNQEQSADVSDHWPIEIQFKDSEFKNEEDFVTEPLTLTLQDKRISRLTKSSIYGLRSTKRNALLGLGYTATSSYKKTGGVKEIELERNVNTVNEALLAVEAMRGIFPKMITSTQVAIARRKIAEMLEFEDPSCHVVQSGFAYRVLSEACSGQTRRNVRSVQLSCSLNSLSCEMRIIAQ